MRDPGREQQSAERYADLADADLVLVAKQLNRELLARTLKLAIELLAGIVSGHGEDLGRLIQVDRAWSIAAGVRNRLKAVRYEIVRRRRRDTPPGTVVQVGKQINTETKIDIKEQSGGSITGLDINSMGGTDADPRNDR
jgi:hypothetical protein